MALLQSKLSCLMAGGGSDVYSYETPDLRAAVVAANYFLPVWGVLNPNDRIHVWSGIGGVVTYHTLAVVAASASSVTVVSTASLT